MLVCEKRAVCQYLEKECREQKNNSCTLRQNYCFPFEEKQENQCDNRERQW